MSSNLNTFISSFKRGARANRFRVAITWPAIVGTPNVRDEVVVKAAGLPASTVGVVQVPYKGRTIPVPGDRTFEDWTITVLNDTTFSHRNAFERWSNAINAHEGNIQNTDTYRNFVATIDIAQLDQNDNVIKTVRLFNAWPNNLTQIDLAYDQNDAVEEFQVTFSYSHWGSSNSPTN